MSEAEFLKVPPSLVAAIEVMNGVHGIGKERVKSLELEGYDAKKVQEIVNFLVLIWEV